MKCIRCIDDTTVQNPRRKLLVAKKMQWKWLQTQVSLYMIHRKGRSPGGCAPTLEVECPAGLESDDWAFEDQLKSRSKEQLQMDLIKIEKILDVARESMAATADEKRLHHALETSHASDIVHGMIEGYVIVDHHLLFCTLRSGRMLFWEDQHDVGHIPPTSVWDISGMSILC